MMDAEQTRQVIGSIESKIRYLLSTMGRANFAESDEHASAAVLNLIQARAALAAEIYAKEAENA